jgi:hypothetical protein
MSILLDGCLSSAHPYCYASVSWATPYYVSARGRCRHVLCQIVVVAKSLSSLTFVSVFLLCYRFWRFFVKRLAHEVTFAGALRLYVAAFHLLAMPSLLLRNYQPSCNAVW